MNPKTNASEKAQGPITGLKGEHLFVFSNSYWHDPVPSLELYGMCLASPSPYKAAQLPKQLENYLNFLNYYFEPFIFC